MARLLGTARLIVEAGKAKPSPKIGQALGPLTVNMMEFCKKFNDRTGDFHEGVPMRVNLRAFEDRTYEFDVGYPSNAWFLKKAAGIEKGTSNAGRDFVGELTLKQIYEIAQVKKRDELSWPPESSSVEGVCRSLLGTCKSMGITVINDAPVPVPPTEQR